MSQSVDKIGLRTLVVVTKADKSPEGLLEKVTADDVNIGLGYVCVRNRIGDESYEEARIEEERLFESHLMLSKIDKSIVGVPVLAQRLVQVQGMIISKTLPEIVKKINEKLTYNLSELDKLPVNLTCVADAMTAFLNLSPFSQQNLQRDVIDRDEETAIIQSNIIFLVLILGVAKDTQLIESIAKKQSQIFSEKCKLFPADFAKIDLPSQILMISPTDIPGESK
ncbi:hypothetical protein AHAS_Ahas05G0102400 [Arachis hypogaea]